MSKKVYPLMRITPLIRRQEDSLQHQEGKQMSVIVQEVNEMLPFTTGKTVCMYGSGINRV